MILVEANGAGQYRMIWQYITNVLNNTLIDYYYVFLLLYSFILYHYTTIYN